LDCTWLSDRQFELAVNASLILSDIGLTLRQLEFFIPSIISGEEDE
jgi:hypothetical protein